MTADIRYGDLVRLRYSHVCRGRVVGLVSSPEKGPEALVHIGNTPAWLPLELLELAPGANQVEMMA